MGPVAPPPSSTATPTSQNNATPTNSLKNGPQVLIKNVNGKVTITPVPGTGTPPGVPQNSHAPKMMNGKKSPPTLRHVKDVQKSHSVPNVNVNVNGHVNQENVARNGNNVSGGELPEMMDHGRKFSLNDGDDPGNLFLF